MSRGGVRDQLAAKLAVSYRDLGPQSLKNIPEPVRAYQVRTVEPAAVPTAVTPLGRRWAASTAIGVVVVAAIVAGWLLLTREEGGVPASPIRSLAVLPLENLSGDPEQEYFADGMTETLIGDLGKIGALKVISRTSVMQYKGARKPLPEIAAELGVDALLEGTVMREGERVRVTVQLIDGRTDHHLWCERYDRDLRGILELQSNVARAVARKIELELTPGEAARLANRPPVDPAAHDALLKGIYHLGRFTPESVRSALASFERAIVIDPGYAPAHAWLGAAWVSLVLRFSAAPYLEGMPKAKSAALRAHELDGALMDAHVVLGWVAYLFDWHWAAAEHHLRRAVELNPSQPGAHHILAFHLAARGRHEEAIAEARRSVELAPLDLVMRSGLGLTYLFTRRFGDAVEELGKLVAMDPTFRLAHSYLGRTYLALGRYEEAIGAFERAGEYSPRIASELRGVVSREGRQGYCRELLRIAQDPAIRVPHAVLAGIQGQLGQRDEAFAELERAYTLREGQLAYLRVEPTFDPIRDDPRFVDLVRRVGIPES